ncbi:MAG: 1-deoxy-D-xylulose-5-phosphate synthase [Alphaproteobacteria bacterium]|nr:1-deoxy-D-xylulose-5-phosphate synthase [Alphaproteobacteria bacterium]
MRDQFIKTLMALANRDKRIWLVAADIGNELLDPFIKRFPERFVNVGIAEQNAVGVCAGLALSGKIPFFYSIAPFVYARPFEFVQVDAAYMELPIKLIGVGAGFGYGSLGATHHAIQDVAVMRALPNMKVFSPGSNEEVEALLRATIKDKMPCYMRLDKGAGFSLPRHSGPRAGIHGYRVKPGMTNVRAGKRAAIIATGNMLRDGIALAEKFGTALYSAHTLKPFDSATILKLAKNKTPIISLEEHSIIGGLATCIAETLAFNGIAAKFLPIAVDDKFSHYVGSEKYIAERMGLGNLEKRVAKFLKDA